MRPGYRDEVVTLVAYGGSCGSDWMVGDIKRWRHDFGVGVEDNAGGDNVPVDDLSGMMQSTVPPVVTS